MGLFSPTTKIHVNSSAYNLAGEYDYRNKRVFQALVLGAALRGSRDGLGKAIARGLINSTAMTQRRFFSWAATNSYKGNVTGQVVLDQPVDTAVVRSVLTTALRVNLPVIIQVRSAVIASVNEEHWAEAWIADNRPADIDELFTSKFLPLTQEISIEFSPTDIETFPAPADYLWGKEDPSRRLLYATYTLHRMGSGISPMISFNTMLYTYRMGSGNVALDAMQTVEGELIPEFYPVIPVRLSNEYVDQRTDYEDWKKAYRKLFRADIADLFTQLDENPDIDDVDHCFVVTGVSLNTKDNSAKRYIYEFFKQLLEVEDRSTFAATLEDGAQHEVTNNPWNHWLNVHKSQKFRHPKFNTMAPFIPTWDVAQSNEIQVSCPNVTEFDVRLRWRTAKEEQCIGNAGDIHGSVPLKVGDVLIVNTDAYDGSSYFGNFKNMTEVGSTLICHQYSKRRFRMITIEGLEHHNIVYGGKAVVISSRDALEDTNDSGFILPLHKPSVTALGLRHGVQMTTANTYLIFNSYKIQVIQWWQTGIFQIILVIAAIAISVVTGGVGLAAAGGVLGNNMALGVMLGATGVTAAVVGAVANAIAATIMMSLINTAAVELFGEKWGAIISAIASFVAMTFATNFAANGNFQVDWGQVMNITNLSEITNALTTGFNQFMAADTNDIYEQMAELEEVYEDELEAIQDHAAEILGMTNLGFDPIILTDAGEYFGESRDLFLSRTLLTGSDLAELSFAMIEDFARISLELPQVST